MVKYTPQWVCSNCILCIFLVTYLLQVTFVMDTDVPIIWSATVADAIIWRPDAIICRPGAIIWRPSAIIWRPGAIIWRPGPIIWRPES